MNNEAKCLNEKGNPVTFLALIETAKEKWHVSSNGVRARKMRSIETALRDENLLSNANTENLGRYSNHTSHYCGKKGHIKSDSDK